MTEHEQAAVDLLNSTIASLTDAERALLNAGGIFAERSHSKRERDRWTDLVMTLNRKGVVCGSNFDATSEPDEEGKVRPVTMKGNVRYSPFGCIVARAVEAE